MTDREIEAPLLDWLTGVLSRPAFLDALEREAKRVRRNALPCSVAMVDLDFFKRINDQHGHAIGDQVLRDLASLLRANCRGSDWIGRYGGDEFSVLLPETDELAAVTWASRLRERIRDHAFGDDGSVRITASIGIAELRDVKTRPEDLLDQADQALLEAKLNGRDAIVAYAASGPGRAIGSSPPIWEDWEAREIMSTAVGVQATDSLAAAADHLIRYRLAEIPVVDRDGRFLGSISARNLLSQLTRDPASNSWRFPRTKVVREVVAPSPSGLFEDRTPLRDLLEFLRQRNEALDGEGIIFLVHEGRLTGMIRPESFVRLLLGACGRTPSQGK